MAPNNKNLNGTSSRVDAIKDLIFGENIQEYDARFSKLESKLNSTEKKLTKMIQNLGKEINSNLETFNKSISDDVEKNFKQLAKQVKALEASKTDKDNLANLLISLAEELKK